MITDSLAIAVNNRSLRSDSDSLLPQKSTSDTVVLKKAEVRTEIPHPGLSGTPIPYHLQSDIGIAIALFFCLFLTAYILSRGKRFLIQQLKDFSFTKKRASIFTTTTVSDFRYRLLLLFQACIVFGICFFDYFHTKMPLLFQQVSPLVVLSIYISVCIAYLLLKWQLYRFLGWIFFDKVRTNTWLEAYAAILYCIGLLLYMAVLLTLYTNITEHVWIPLVLGLLIFTKILMFYKWLKLFFSNMYGVLYLIMYFCALELIPILLIYQVLIHINNLLLIKQ